MKIREVLVSDWDAIWPIFHEVVKAGETYAYDMSTSKAKGKQIWFETPLKTFIFEDCSTNSMKPHSPNLTA